MAPIAAKLWQTALRKICNFSFFDAEKNFRKKKIEFFWGLILVFKQVRFWRSYEFLSVIGRCVVKSYCPNCPYFWGDFLGKEVNDSICDEILDLAPKATSTIWSFDGKINDIVVIRFRDNSTLWQQPLSMPLPTCVGNGDILLDAMSGRRSKNKSARHQKAAAMSSVISKQSFIFQFVRVFQAEHLCVRNKTFFVLEAEHS